VNKHLKRGDYIFMKSKRCLIGIFMFLAFVAVAAAGDISGKWIAVKNSDVEMVFKVKGTTLKGTVNSPQLGKAKIQDGKIVDNNIYFWILRKIGKDEARTYWNGSIEGDVIRFTRTIRGGGPVHITVIKPQTANESGK
jgi:hypothetical protein